MKSTLKFATYDAELDTGMCDARNNAELTLTLKLGFRQINPAGGAKTGIYNDFGSASGDPRRIVPWTPTEWTLWKSQFVRSAEKYWHGRFWLVNNCGAYPYKLGTQILLPNVWCKFKLIGSDASLGGHHHVIDVVRLDPTETWFGSHSRLYDSLDTKSVRKGMDSKGKPIMQQAHVHEVGHLLGIGHVDIGKAHCPTASNTNAKVCYGIADVDKNSVMGQGMQLRLTHAFPWLDALQRLYKAAPKSAVYTPPPLVLLKHLLQPFDAKTVRHYPRTANQYETGILLT